MDTDSPVKDILYEEISKISEKAILLDISKGNSPKIISALISNCILKIEKMNQNIDEYFGILAESLMHYFLTLSIIPSQRKVSYKNIEIDIVIPDLKTLDSNPNDALVILFPKSNDRNVIQKRISEISNIQPNEKNIWIVLHENLNLKNKLYAIDNRKNSFNRILEDVKDFSSSKKQNKFKIMK